MACKIVFIGGGSFLWSARFATDLFLKESLRGSRLALVDIDPESLDLVAGYCRKLNESIGSGWTIETAEQNAALEGADYVMVSIAVGGLKAFDRDYRIPESYGIYHTVGDTVGPAGISRVLRNVPVFLDIARRMERICPDAWMIHVTNPLAQLTRAVCKASSVKTMGLCHNYEGTMRFLADFLGAKREELDANTYGVNHFSWLRDLTCKGQPVVKEQLTVAQYLRYEANKKGILETGTTDDDINAMLDANTDDDERLGFELCETFGSFPVGGPPHIAENFPYYLNDPETIKRHHIRRKGVLPVRAEGRKTKRQRVERINAGTEPLEEPKASHESLADIVEAMHTGKLTRAVVNMPNSGQVGNLPKDVVVETWATIGKDSVTPESGGNVPAAIKGFLESIVAEEELAVEAALTGDRTLVTQAMMASPLLFNKDAAGTLADELLTAQRDWLPQFRGLK